MSERMKAVADFVSVGRKVADIGCDHAYISIFLLEKEIAERVIALDVRKGPLDIANANINAYLSDTPCIETRMSNGFDKVNEGETDAAVIAGMGGLLIVDILRRGKRLFTPGYELILSPQSEQYDVRKYLATSGFRIVDEKLLIDEGKYYNVIKAVKGIAMPEKEEKPDTAGDSGIMQAISKLSNGEKDAESWKKEAYLTYGRILLERKDSVLRAKLISEYDSKMKLLDKLSGNNSEAATVRRAELEGELTLLRRTLKEYYNMTES